MTCILFVQKRLFVWEVVSFCRELFLFFGGACLMTACTERHELTSWKSFPSIFKFFSEAMEAKNSSVKPTPTRRSNRIKYEEL
ncbi:hypothetical protein Q9233_004964 [Columba guinea]|nr:hypothetical protein Q9233_004964 [Columba guinea]